MNPFYVSKLLNIYINTCLALKIMLQNQGFRILLKISVICIVYKHDWAIVLPYQIGIGFLYRVIVVIEISDYAVLLVCSFFFCFLSSKMLVDNLCQYFGTGRKLLTDFYQTRKRISLGPVIITHSVASMQWSGWFVRPQTEHSQMGARPSVEPRFRIHAFCFHFNIFIYYKQILYFCLCQFLVTFKMPWMEN